MEAEQAYREAIGLDPAYEEAYYNLGVLLRESRPSEAQALFRTALGLDPRFSSAYRELGYLLSKAGNAPEAEGHLRKAIELDSADAWAHVYLGTYLWQCADIEGAEAEFRTAANLRRDWAVPLWSLGNLYENSKKDLGLAQGCFERALNVEPDDETALRGLNRVRQKRSST